MGCEICGTQQFPMFQMTGGRGVTPVWFCRTCYGAWVDAQESAPRPLTAPDTGYRAWYSAQLAAFVARKRPA